MPYPPAHVELPIQCHEARDLMRHWLKVAANHTNNEATRSFAIAEAEHWRGVAQRIEAERGQLA